MSWITVIYSMTAAMCLTLAAVHCFAWLRMRDLWENFFFSLSAIAAGFMAMQELVMMHSSSPEAFGQVLRWMHVSAAILTISMVWFIRLHLGAGRIWLAWSICGLRVLLLLANFFAYPNATFAEIHSLKSITFLDETLMAPVGEANPWRILAQLSGMLLLVYAIDAAATAWKQGRRRQSAVLGASVSIAVIWAQIFSNLMTQGSLPGAFISLLYTLIVLAMAFDLSVDLIRARVLAQALQVSQERIGLATRAANLRLWDWDIVRDTIWVNDGQVDTDDSERMSFTRYLQQVHPDDRDVLRQAVHRTLDKGQDIQTAFRLCGPAGARWITARGQLERDAQGKPLCLRGVSVDVTEQRQVADELRRQRDELAHVQRVSTLGQLASALAHELNQPLGAILRNAEAAELFLRQEPPDLVELHEILVDIQRDDQRAAAVIERMSALLRYKELHFEAIAVDELIEQVTALLHGEVQARHAVLQTDVPAGLPRIQGDRIHLQQVILNLVLNSLEALEASSEPPRQITIRAVLTEDHRVEVTVMDNGPGIDPDRSAELFKLFFTTKSRGSGAGLAISKTIIEAHDGRIWADNNPCGGARFSFSVPVAIAGNEL